MAGDLKELSYKIDFDINSSDLNKTTKIETDIDKIFQNIGVSVKKVDNSIGNMANSTSKANTSVKGVAEALNTTNTIGQKLTQVTQGISNGFSKASDKAKGIAESLKSVKDTAEKTSTVTSAIGRSLAGLGVGIGVGAAVKGTISTFADFEQQMAGVHATLGQVSNQDMTTLTNKAKEMSNKWGIAAKDVAEGEENLASAGFEAKDILNTLEPSLLLATAGQIKMGDATNSLSSTIRSFGLDTKDAQHVVDSFAQAAASTNAAMPDMAEAMKYAAQPAHAFGWTLEQTEAAIGALSNNAIKGSMAGTTLREMFSRLIKPTEDAYQLMKDLGFKAIDPTTHKLKPLPQLIGDLQKSLENLNPAQRNAALSEIFGQEALTGVLALVQTGPDELEKLTKAFKDSDGAAKQMAETQNDILAGSLRLLKANVQNTSADIAKETGITDWIKNVATDIVNNKDTIVNNILGIKDVAGGFISFMKDNGPAAAGAIGGVTAALATFQTISFVIPIIANITGVMEKLGFAMTAVSTGTFTLGGAMAFLMGPIGWATLAIGVLAGGFIFWKTASKETKDAVIDHLYGILGVIEEVINFAIDQFNWLAEKINFVTDALNKVPVIGKMLDIPQIDMGKHLTTSTDYFAKREREKKGQAPIEVLQMAGVQGGYATGTNNATAGLHPVAENGFEIVLGKQFKMFNGGEKVLNNNVSSALLNQTASTNMGSVVGNYDSAITDLLPKFSDYGEDINKNLSQGIDQNSPTVSNSINNLTNKNGALLNNFSQNSIDYGTQMVNEIAQGVTDSESNLTNVVKSLTDKVINQFKSGFGIHSPSRVMHQIGDYLMQGLVNGMTSKDMEGFITNQVGSMVNYATGAVSGNVSDWIMAALLTTGTDPSWLPGMLRLASFESGDPGVLGSGSATLVNNVGVGGEYATGLMQTLPSTFREFMQPGMNEINNPVHNAAAAINYIKSRYGSVYNTPLFRGGSYVGYATGTDSATPGLHWVGEKGPELMSFKGGEQVIDNKKSMDLISSTPYNSNSQSGNSMSMGDVNINITVNDTGNARNTAIEVDRKLRETVKDIFEERFASLSIQLGYKTIPQS